MSSQHVLGDHILGYIASGYNVKKSLNSSDPGYEGMLGKSWHEYCGYFNGMAPPDRTTVDEEGQTDLSSNTNLSYCFGGFCEGRVDKGEDKGEYKYFIQILMRKSRQRRRR
ncbi:unnamed protein product [Musa acuminata var. zebrina]